MQRLSCFTAALLATLLGACGDAREPFTGTYDLEGSIELSDERGSASFATSSTTELVADAFDSERLYVGFDCGLSGVMKDEQTFDVSPKNCPQFTDEDCRYKMIFESGVGSRGAEGNGLRLVLKGTYTIRCDDGTSDRLSFSFALSGDKLPASTDTPDNGASSAPTPTDPARGLHALLRQRVRESATRE